MDYGLSMDSGLGFQASDLTTDPGESLYSLGNPNDDPYAAPKSYSYLGDQAEAAKMDQFYAGTALGSSSMGTSAPWWQSLATYGVSRAIDAAVGPKITGSGGQQSTYAGQNGQTYVNGRAPTYSGDSSMGGLLPLLILGGIAYAVLG